MAYNFRRGDRDQPFLLPPDLRDWLPAGHLAWFVLDVVDQLDLGPFLRGYRADGHGHPAYHPKLLLGVLLYAYAIGVRSSRQTERRCTEDLAFRVLVGNQTPDHVTIARFRVRHQQALAGFLVESLRLCAAAGLVRLGVVALDGTKVAANAATTASHTHDKIKAQVAEILRQAAETDQREDLEDGQLRLPGPGQAYYQRRRTQGDATGQVVRALKRRIVRAVYQHLRAALPPADTLHTAAA